MITQQISPSKICEYLTQKSPQQDPPDTKEGYDIPELSAGKSELNSAKSLLDPIYARAMKDKLFGKAWFFYNREYDDPFAKMRFILEAKYGAQHVSNAWLKFYEMQSYWKFAEHLAADLSTHPASGKPRPLRTFFNAELPGASICAFNHYCRTRQIDYQWRASSYRPPRGTGTALGDNYGIYAKNPRNWLMNDEDPQHGGFDGDMTSVRNILYLEKNFAHSVDFYTHDAGMSLGEPGKEDFGAQEQINAKLHLGCAIAGFVTLRPGGSFIAKQYTAFETLTWNLICVYANLFDKFFLCKPITSRARNSEIYLIGTGFHGFPDSSRDSKKDDENYDIRALLLAKLADFDMSPIIPAGALGTIDKQIGEIKSFCRVFSQQAQSIRRGIKIFESNPADELADLAARNEEIRENWLREHPVPRISRRDWVPSL